MNAGHWWLLFGIVAGLLPSYLLVRTMLHILNIDFPRRDRGSS